jgi:hypothetical protein
MSRVKTMADITQTDDEITFKKKDVNAERAKVAEKFSQQKREIMEKDEQICILKSALKQMEANMGKGGEKYKNTLKELTKKENEIKLLNAELNSLKDKKQNITKGTSIFNEITKEKMDKDVEEEIKKKYKKEQEDTQKYLEELYKNCFE